MKPGVCVVAALAVLLNASAARACPGDCNRDTRVAVAELIQGVRIALGQAAADSCAAVDGDLSGDVAVVELVAAVRAALAGCSLAFDTAQRYAAGDSPRSVVVANLDDDVWPDIAVANHISHDVSVLLNDGTGAFLPQVRHAVGLIPLGIAIADFDADGADIATANGGSGDVSILLGRGDGSFEDERRYPARADARTILAARIDANQTINLVIASPAGAGINVLFGRGDGTFDATVIGAGFRPWWVALGDVTGDAVADLVTANAESFDLTVLAGLGGGSFVGRSRLPLRAAGFSVAIADVDRDEVADLLTGNGQNASVSLLLGSAAGSFAAPVRIGVGDGPFPVHVADMNGDALPDIVTANELSDDVSIRLGRGDGTFEMDQRVAIGASPYAVALSDLNRDGTLDIVAATGADDEVAVRLRTADPRQ